MSGTIWARMRRPGLPLLGLALVVVVGCGRETVEEMPEEAPAAAPTMPEAPVVAAAELGTNPAAHEGMTVRVNRVQVTGTVGTSAVWVELPTTPAPTPFLIHVANPPAPGATIDVVGQVKPVAAAELDQWVSSGEISENDRLVVEFATHYMDAESVQPAGM